MKSTLRALCVSVVLWAYLAIALSVPAQDLRSQPMKVEPLLGTRIDELLEKLTRRVEALEKVPRPPMAVDPARLLFGEGVYELDGVVITRELPTIRGLGPGRTTLERTQRAGPPPGPVGLRPSAANGAGEPARGDAPARTAPFVTVSNFGSGTPWDERFASVSQLTVDGRESIGKFPYADAQEIARSGWCETDGCDGIYLDGQGATVDDVRVHSFRGIGITSRTGGLAVRRAKSYRNYVGVRLTGSDSSIADSFIFDNRDCCGWLPASAGNVQSSQTHYYGARVAFYNEGGQGFRSTNDTMADAAIGYLGNTHGSGSGYAVLRGVHLQHNHVRAAILRSGPVTMTGCIIQVPQQINNARFAGIIPRLPDYEGCVGLDVQAPWVSVTGGSITLTHYHHGSWPGPFTAAEAVWLRALDWGPWAADFCTIECPLLDADRLNGSIGIRVTGPRKGVRVNCPIGMEPPRAADGSRGNDHWTHALDRVLVVEHATLRDCQFTFRGTQQDLLTNPEKYVDLPAGWRPPGSGNAVTLIRADTGGRLELENRAY